MPADINSYALGLELQLQTKSAFDALTKIEQKLASIEKRVAEVAPVPAVTEAFEEQATAVGLDALKHYQLEKATNDLMEVEHGLHRLHEEMAGSAEHLNMTFEEMAKEEQKLLNKRGEALRVIEKLSDSTQKLTKDEQDIFKLAVDVIKQTDERIEQFKSLQDQFDKHSKAVKFLKPALDALGISQEEATEFLGAYTKGAGLAFVAITLLSKGLIEVIKMQEAYAKTTFRALGSQFELIETSNALRSTLGATSEQAVETLSALAAAGFHASDSLGELTEANYMFARSTGVSANETAIYQRGLANLGMTAPEVMRNLGNVSAAIRNSGLTASEASGMMDRLAKSMIGLKFAFDAKQAKSMTDTVIKFGAAAKKAGVQDVSGLTSEMNDLAKSPIALQVRMGQLGIQYDETADQAANFAKLAAEAPSAIAAKMKEMGTAGFQAFAKGAGITEDFYNNMQQIGEVAGWSADKVKKMTDGMTANADLTEDFNAAMTTFKDTMHRLMAPLLTLGAQLMETIGPALISLLKPLVIVATAVGKFISFLDKIPGISSLIKGAFMMWLVPSIWKSITTFTKFGEIFPSLTKKFTTISAIMRGFGPQMGAITGSIVKQAFAGRLLTKETGTMVQSLGQLIKTMFLAKGATAETSGILRQFIPAAEGAGEGLMGMGSGALQAAMGLAAAHPLITAVVAAIAGAFILVPKFFEMFNTGSAATSALAVALMGLFWPLTSLYVTLRTVWAVVKGVWEAVSELAETAFKPLTEAFKEWFGQGDKTVSLMDVFNKAMDKLTKVTKAFFKVFSPVVWLFKMLGGVTQFVVTSIKKVLDTFAPVVKFAEWAINKISKFLGLDDDVAEESKKTAEVVTNAYDEMWGTAEQRFQAAQEQMKFTGDRLRETKALITPEITQTIKAVSQAPAAQKAEPIVTPVITDRTARARSEELQEKMLNANMVVGELIFKLLSKTDASKSDSEKAIDLLKLWLPRIAEGKSDSLATAANQWL